MDEVDAQIKALGDLLLQAGVGEQIDRPVEIDQEIEVAAGLLFAASPGAEHAQRGDRIALSQFRDILRAAPVGSRQAIEVRCALLLSRRRLERSLAQEGGEMQRLDHSIAAVREVATGVPCTATSAGPVRLAAVSRVRWSTPRICAAVRLRHSITACAWTSSGMMLGSPKPTRARPPGRLNSLAWWVNSTKLSSSTAPRRNAARQRHSAVPALLTRVRATWPAARLTGPARSSIVAGVGGCRQRQDGGGDGGAEHGNGLPGGTASRSPGLRFFETPLCR